jgi:hypothetical protein
MTGRRVGGVKGVCLLDFGPQGGERFDHFGLWPELVDPPAPPARFLLGG